MLRKIFLFCGILSSFLYIAMNIFVPMFFPGYDSASQTVSELSAIGSPTRTLWVSLGTAYTLLIMVFGLGVRQSARQNKKLKIAGGFIFVYGIVSLAWPFAPMHQREILARDGESLTDKIHLALAMVTVLLMMASMAFGAAAFEKKFLLYSIATISILLVFGALTGWDAGRVKSNLSTPWVGIWERINIGIFLLWIIVLSIMILRQQKGSRQNRVK
jgi:hypothetical protein